MLSQGQDEPINYDAAMFITLYDQYLEQILFQTDSGYTYSVRGNCKDWLGQK